MLEEIIANLESEDKTSLKPFKRAPHNTPLRKSLLIQSQELGSYANNKSMSFFFNTLDEEKISRGSF